MQGREKEGKDALLLSKITDRARYISLLQLLLSFTIIHARSPLLEEAWQQHHSKRAVLLCTKGWGASHNDWLHRAGNDGGC